jgi:DNA-binding response OmpR family regulator
MQLLCADDDDDICAILRLALSLDAGLKPHIVRSGDAALAYAATHPVDAILLDAMMPGIDGYETCRLLKANKPFDPLTLAKELKGILDSSPMGNA